MLIVFEKTHHTAETLFTRNNDRVSKVMLSVFFAAVMTALSVVYAAHPISKGNLRPFIWLAPIAVGCTVFVLIFDSRGLLK